jgi:hypothetical protein
VLDFMATEHSFGGVVACFAHNWLAQEHQAYVSASERIQEADRVDPLVRQYAEYELQPPACGPLRSIGAARVEPPLGRVLERWLGGADDETVRGVAEAVIRAIASGYGSLALLEPEAPERLGPIKLVGGRNARNIWAFWVSNFRRHVLKEFGLQQNFMKRVHHIAASEILSGLDRVGIKPRVHGRTRLGVLGRTYGDAGAILRLAQTNVVSEARLGRNHTGLGIDVGEVLLRWPITHFDRAELDPPPRRNLRVVDSE